MDDVNQKSSIISLILFLHPGVEIDLNSKNTFYGDQIFCFL